MRVMLIDDHPIVRAGLRAVLNSFGDIDVVAEASDGTAEVPADVDVVVSDIQMPGADGIELTRRLVAEGGPPVLILTTYDTQADVVAAVEAGAMGYLLKDAPEDELHDAVVAAAQRERTLSPQVANTLAERVLKPDEALSGREIELLKALQTGMSNRDIAEALFISQATVKTHLIHIYAKLGVDNRTAAVDKARERRII
ncbi:response regulator transcription factor [Corynebacterium sp. CCUG 65737]|uniref:response regulator transcription factor n=1 Tax=unclassified Corynebacterium TaxID=2624378 RepID=UPI0021091372|nr:MULTISPECIES: response regulator transcription factor [unclassified Corynebacterium]MCQ4617762.1 response regulator transcription factor [Corynebacterium pseudogenitalium]MCQ4622334.1 response regulator transcription factor [Corynebacterium sp. CCUG 70398]MCQ4626532.1 response regulator transcription factor [Corynebacterium sp. CCUG 65737]